MILRWAWLSLGAAAVLGACGGQVEMSVAEPGVGGSGGGGSSNPGGGEAGGDGGAVASGGVEPVGGRGGGTGGAGTGAGPASGGSGGGSGRCGDGVRQGREQCDDGNTRSGDGCSADCSSDETCGNGIVDSAAGEQCDDAGLSRTCDYDCTRAECGDGIANAAAGEDCDDRGESADCDPDCTPAVCGDGFTNRSAGEVCDDGGNSASCDVDCTLPGCGDGRLNTSAGEACDDGNLDCGDTCTPTCALQSLCGNGVVDPGELCDDGNTSDDDACSACCMPTAIVTTVPVMLVGSDYWRGWWSTEGHHDSYNDNTATGRCLSCLYGPTVNSYYVFDLSGLVGSVVSVELRLELETYHSADLSETCTVYDVATPADVLESGGDDPNVFEDLQTGNSYGLLEVTPDDVGHQVSVTLNDPGIGDVQAALGGHFAIALTISSLGDQSDEYVRFSEASEPRRHELVVTLSP